jgi:hypothetical protein
MKNALMAVAITALMGGLVIAPVTQQSAEAQVYVGLKTLNSNGGTPTSGTTNDRGDVILVGRGGGRGGHGVVMAAAIGVAAAITAAATLPMAADELTATAMLPMAADGTTAVADITPAKATRTTTPITTTIAAITGTVATGTMGGTAGLTPTAMATAIARGSAVRLSSLAVPIGGSATTRAPTTTDAVVQIGRTRPDLTSRPPRLKLSTALASRVRPSKALHSGL